MKTTNHNKSKSKKRIKIFHTVLGFRLITLSGGAEEDIVSENTPSGIIYDLPLITHIMNR